MPFVFKNQLTRVPITVPVNLNIAATGYMVGTSSTGINLGPVGGAIEKVQAVVKVVGAGAGASITVTPRINNTATTGGVLTLTLAGTTPLGTIIDGTAVTGANAFGANALLQLHSTVTTVFTGGEVVVAIGTKRYLASG